jgi:hypothetical protein
LLVAALSLTLVLGTVVLVVNHSAARAAYLRDHPADPLTDDQASAQVVDAVVDIVRTAGLRDPAGGYAFRSCKNADDPPYQLTVDMTFALPQGNSVGYLDDVATAMVGLGWTDTGSQSEHFGRKLTRAALTSVFARNPERLDLATMRVYGECRVVTDHHADDPVWTELTARLRQVG